MLNLRETLFFKNDSMKRKQTYLKKVQVVWPSIHSQFRTAVHPLRRPINKAMAAWLLFISLSTARGLSRAEMKREMRGGRLASTEEIKFLLLQKLAIAPCQFKCIEHGTTRRLCGVNVCCGFNEEKDKRLPEHEWILIDVLSGFLPDNQLSFFRGSDVLFT